MQKGNELSQTTTWIRLLASQENQPRLVGILQSSLSLARQLMASCQLNELVSFYKASDVNRQLMADTIVASACDTLICDRQHYNALIYILSLRQHPMTVILNQENYMPDWCWQFPQHRFYVNKT